MNLVIRFIVYLLTGAVIGAAILIANTPKAENTAFKLVDNPKIHRPQPEGIVAKLLKKKISKPKKKTGQLLRVGIVDTGYDKELDDIGIPLCDKGHFNFETGTPTIGMGSIPHGMAVAQSIMETAGDINLCFVFYQVEGILGITSVNVDAALKMARSAGLVAVNMSLVGPGYSFSEKKLLDDLGKNGISVFIAAGNDHRNLDEACVSYPGCYKVPNTYVVGALDGESDLVASYSNFGTKVDIWKSGEVIFHGQRVRGTSFASPHALGDYVRSLSEAGQQ